MEIDTRRSEKISEPVFVELEIRENACCVWLSRFDSVVYLYFA